RGAGLRVPDTRVRADAALELVRGGGREGLFSSGARFYGVNNLWVGPRPPQRPPPPIRVAVHTEESFAHLADLGWPIYSGTTTTPLPQLRDCMAVYRHQLAAAGHAWRDDQMALMLPIHVGATSAAAREAMRPGVLQYYRNIHALF